MDQPFQSQSGTGEDHVLEVVRDGRQRILLDHVPDAGELPLGLARIVAGNELDPLEDVQIGPVDTIRGVTVVRTNQTVEGVLLVQIHLLERLVGARHVRAMRRSWPVVRHGVDLAILSRYFKTSWLAWRWRTRKEASQRGQSHA